MKIKFVEDGPLEYKTGEWHAKNDGEPIEVDNPHFAAELIATGYFEEAPEPEVPTTKDGLMKLGKDALAEMATGMKLEIPPKAAKNAIADAILEEQSNSDTDTDSDADTDAETAE